MSLKVELLKHQEITTKRLLLRPVRLADAEDFYRIGSDPENNRFTIHYPNMDATLSGMADYWMGDPLGKYAVVMKGTNQFAGAVEVHLDERNQKAEIGYLITRRFWGNGYAPEAAAALLDLCFNILHLNRVEAMYDSRNHNSGRVLEKLGMHVEGRLRNDRIDDDGTPITTVVTAITAREYRENRD